jgi:hypothetical protein
VLFAVKSADTIERAYFFTAYLLFAVLIITVYSLTQITYTTQGLVDVIFTTDSGFYILNDIFFKFYAPSNDLRQSLFALVTIPFAVAAKMLAIPLFFLPSPYVLIMQLIQIAALLIISILLARMMELKKGARLVFLILYALTYPFLLFSLCIEQYIPSLFVLVCAVYFCMYRKEKSDYHLRNKKRHIRPKADWTLGWDHILLAMSGGVLITNMFIVPFATYSKKFSEWFLNAVKVALSFLALCVLCGKLPVIVNSIFSINRLMQFTTEGEGVSTYNKTIQFIQFISSCIIAPNVETYIDWQNLMVFQLGSPSSASIFIGIAAAIAAVFSILVNRKKFAAKICGQWLVLTCFILYIMGYGSPENGMILYSLYFGWAFAVLIFMLVEKLLGNYPISRYFVYTIAFIALARLNLGGILYLIRFGIAYHPV